VHRATSAAGRLQSYHLKTTFAVHLAWILVLTTQYAQAAAPTDEVGRVVRAEMVKQHIPGLALPVSRNGAPIRAQGFGWRVSSSTSRRSLKNQGNCDPQRIVDEVAAIYLENKVGARQ
jgi:hypothetical protein